MKGITVILTIMTGIQETAGITTIAGLM